MSYLAQATSASVVEEFVSDSEPEVENPHPRSKQSTNNVFPVHRIIGRRVSPDKGVEYHVRWGKRYQHHTWDSWEPEASLRRNVALTKFKAKLRAKKQTKKQTKKQGQADHHQATFAQSSPLTAVNNQPVSDASFARPQSIAESAVTPLPSPSAAAQQQAVIKPTTSPLSEPSAPRVISVAPTKSAVPPTIKPDAAAAAAAAIAPMVRSSAAVAPTKSTMPPTIKPDAAAAAARMVRSSVAVAPTKSTIKPDAAAAAAAAAVAPMVKLSSEALSSTKSSIVASSSALVPFRSTPLIPKKAPLHANVASPTTPPKVPISQPLSCLQLAFGLKSTYNQGRAASAMPSPRMTPPANSLPMLQSPRSPQPLEEDESSSSPLSPLQIELLSCHTDTAKTAWLCRSFLDATNVAQRREQQQEFLDASWGAISLMQQWIQQLLRSRASWGVVHVELASTILRSATQLCCEHPSHAIWKSSGNELRGLLNELKQCAPMSLKHLFAEFSNAVDTATAPSLRSTARAMDVQPSEVAFTPTASYLPPPPLDPLHSSQAPPIPFAPSASSTFFAPAMQDNAPTCRFFRHPRGCFRASACPFLHV